MNRIILAALIAATASPAFAHAHLLRETPVANATAAAPSALTLTFSERLEPKFSGVAVTGPDNKPVGVGTPSLGGSDGTILTVPLAGALAAGAYTVAWHALSTDGHKTAGTYQFTVK
jgi:hypothetical protein